jgi:hypothetical protein
VHQLLLTGYLKGIIMIRKHNLKNAAASTLNRRLNPELYAREQAVAQLKRDAEWGGDADILLDEYNALTTRAEKTAFATQLPSYKEYLRKAKQNMIDIKDDPEVQKSYVIRSRIRNMQQRAKDDSRAFGITESYLRKLLEESGMKCNISGRDVTLDTNDPDVVSFDRINNNKGYVYDNIQVVSSAINTAKLTWTQEEFIEIAKQICKHNGVKI